MLLKEAMKTLGISYSTIQRYVKRGLIRRYKYMMPGRLGKYNYYDEDIYALLGAKWNKHGNQIAAYFRVNGKTKADDARMLKQRMTVFDFCAARGISIDHAFEDRASGAVWDMKRRPALHNLLKSVFSGKVNAVVVETKCRISSFAFDAF